MQAFHQQGADEIWGNLLGGAGEERLREGLGERAGDGSGTGTWTEVSKSS